MIGIFITAAVFFAAGAVAGVVASVLFSRRNPTTVAQVNKVVTAASQVGSK